MKIDKSLGDWSHNSTLLDDYAFQLYINYMIETYKNISFGPQSHFAKSYYNFGEYSPVYHFYKEAEIILRKEKLLKLSNL